MIVSTATHRRTLDELAHERGRREELTQRCTAQQTMIEFLISRVNQLEKERAVLFTHITNVEIPVPSFSVARAADTPSIPEDPVEALAAMSSIFEDDPAHAPAGWHQDGSVNYGKKVG